jgi:hypothetical protein
MTDESEKRCDGCRAYVPIITKEGVGVCDPKRIGLPYWLHVGTRYVMANDPDAAKCKAHKAK